MSKIQVDAIEQQTACGTTLTAGGGAGKTVVVDATTVTLGRCGGTVALASGASQTGFGRTGTVDWNTTPKTATFTAVSGDGFFANTSGGAFNMNLPAGVAGAIVSVADYAGTWQTNAVTVVPNGSDKIGAINQNATLNTEGQSVTFVFVDSTQGWVNTMDSTSNVRGTPPFIQATGGTPSQDGDFEIRTFTGPGTFQVTSISPTPANNAIEYLVIAGAGGGGGTTAPTSGGGGGGAGGFRTSFCAPATPLTATVASFPITVGAGGAGGAGAPTSPDTKGVNGSSSIFSTITSAGGGGGGGSACNSSGNGSSTGLAGGSGGGAGAWSAVNVAGGAGNTPPTSPPQGNAGSPSNTTGAPNYGSGGGGGAGGAGSAGTPTVGGNGGAGAANSITGSAVTRAGGGGGSTLQGGTRSSGGSGGGGAGSTGQPCQPGAVAGTVNTGGGGGGSTYHPATAGGGSGTVIVRIPAAAAPGSVAVAPGTNSLATLSPSGDKLATFTVSGTLTL